MALSSPRIPPPAPSVADLPDVLLEDIFLRLPAAADLARASATCTSFRRVIAGHAFLRRYRALHPPPLVGILHDHVPFVPAQPPHPSAVPARAFAGFDFSCSSFLPSTPEHTWIPIDFFDGRVLLDGAYAKERSRGILFSRHRQFWDRDLAVCDPVHRRCIVLPAVPGDLKVLVPQLDLLTLQTFLAPGEDEEDPLSFRVMCFVECTTKLLLLVFSSSLSGQGQWHALTFDQWSGDATHATAGSVVRSDTGLSNRQFVHGCFYWHLIFRAELLVLDVCALEFSAVNLPPEQGFDCFDLFEAAEGMLGMLTEGYDHYREDDQYWLTYSILRNNQWHLEKVIQLPVKHVHLVDVAGRYLLIQAWYTAYSQEKPKFGYFSLDLKTFQVELFAELSKPIFYGRPYASFPPSLCAPTI